MHGARLLKNAIKSDAFSKVKLDVGKLKTFLKTYQKHCRDPNIWNLGDAREHVSTSHKTLQSFAQKPS